MQTVYVSVTKAKDFNIRIQSQKVSVSFLSGVLEHERDIINPGDLTGDCKIK